MERTAPKRKPRTSLLHVDLKELHGPWTDWCETRSLTPSEAVRRVLSVVLKGNPTQETAPHPADYGVGEGAGARRRVEIRIPESEFLALTAAADQDGLSVPRWLTALVRSHLTGDQMLGRGEVEALSRSNALLLALSRNINQIAFNLHRRTDADTLTAAQIEFLSQFLKEHIAATAAVLHANAKRWRT